MFAQAALCLSSRACPGLENLFLMLYREYRYSIEKKNREVCGFLSYTQEYRYSLRLFFTFFCANRANTASIDQYDRVEFLCFKFTGDQVRTHLLPVLFFLRSLMMENSRSALIREIASILVGNAFCNRIWVRLRLV